MSSNFDTFQSRVTIRPYEIGENLPDFGCGKSWFDNFINTDEVAKYQRERLGETKLVFLDGEFVAYFCLSPNSMTDDDFNEDETKGAEDLYDGPYDMPARLLGHLAVDEEHQEQYLGEFLLKHIIALTDTSNIPFRVLILHSHQNTTEFYKRYGFVESLPNESNNSGTTLMFFDLGPISE